jgi:hypothetical protein
VKDLLKNMEKVLSNDWYASCTIYPCWYEGNIGNGKEDYEVLINAGGYVILTNSSKTLHFINREKTNIFLQGCDCCE